MDINNIIKLVEGAVVTVGLQVLGALALYIIGRWLITFAVGLVQKGLAQQKLKPTLLRFIGNTISVVFDTNMAIREVLGDGTFPAPMPVFGVQHLNEMGRG